MNSSLKIAYALGKLSFFVLWACVAWGMFKQDWSQVTAFAALLCAINTTWRAK